MDMHATLIGAPVSQIQGPDKVAGRTRFAADVHIPGMLWGKILRSPHPHARIRRIDASAAWRVPGVKAVVTGQDAPGLLMGKVLRDMPVLGPGALHRRPGRRGRGGDARRRRRSALAHRRRLRSAAGGLRPYGSHATGCPLLHDDVASYAGAPLDVLATDARSNAAGVGQRRWVRAFARPRSSWSTRFPSPAVTRAIWSPYQRDSHRR